LTKASPVPRTTPPQKSQESIAATRSVGLLLLSGLLSATLVLSGCGAASDAGPESVSPTGSVQDDNEDGGLSAVLAFVDEPSKSVGDESDAEDDPSNLTTKAEAVCLTTYSYTVKGLSTPQRDTIRMIWTQRDPATGAIGHVTLTTAHESAVYANTHIRPVIQENFSYGLRPIATSIALAAISDTGKTASFVIRSSSPGIGASKCKTIKNNVAALGAGTGNVAAQAYQLETRQILVAIVGSAVGVQSGIVSAASVTPATRSWALAGIDVTAAVTNGLMLGHYARPYNVAPLELAGLKAAFMILRATDSDVVPTDVVRKGFEAVGSGAAIPSVVNRIAVNAMGAATAASFVKTTRKAHVDMALQVQPGACSPGVPSFCP
jgi:hypothetical protein